MVTGQTEVKYNREVNKINKIGEPVKKIKYTIRSIGCEASCYLVTRSLGHLVTWSLGHSVTSSCIQSLVIVFCPCDILSFQCAHGRTDGLTDRQHQDLQVCFADKNIERRIIQQLERNILNNRVRSVTDFDCT